MVRLRGDVRHLPLTRHEYDALYYRALTSTRKEAAKQAGISETAERHALTSVMRKLGVPNVLEAFRSQGWLHPVPWDEYIDPHNDEDPRPSVPWTQEGS